MPSGTVEAVFNVLSGIVALLVTYYAYKNNKILESNLLRYISAGFLILGLSLFLEAGTETLARITPVDAVRVRGAELVLFLIYTAMEFVAYLVFTWGYVLSSLRRPENAPEGAPGPTAPAAAGGAAMAAFLALATRTTFTAIFVYTVYLLSQLAIVLLLLFIVYHGVLVFSRTKSNLSLMVLFGFMLIFVSHIVLFTSAAYTSSVLLLIGDTVQFCGFVALAFFLYWSGRVVR